MEFNFFLGKTPVMHANIGLWLSNNALSA